MKANLFIVGVPKGGTTSILDFLSLNKDICVSSVKEPNYFSYNEIKELYDSNRYLQLVKAYTGDKAYHSLYDKPARFWAEASVSYLYYPSVAQKIKSYNPSSKIVICLREPVSRALSHHEMDIRLGFIDKSLPDILKEPEKHKTEFEQYVIASRYSEQVSRYLNVFGTDNVLILYFEDITQKPELVIKELGDFLSLQFEENEIPHQNRALRSNSAFIAALYKSVRIRHIFKTILPSSTRDALKNVFFSANNNHDDQVKLKNELYELLKNDLTDLEGVLNTDLSNWRRKDEQGCLHP